MSDFFKGTVTPKDWAAVCLILALSGLVAIGFYFLVFQRQDERLVALTASNEQLALDLQKAREIEANIDALRTEMAKIEQLVTQFETRLPHGSEIQTLLEKFEGLASEVGVDVELSKGVNRPDGLKEIIPYQVIARGNFHQIVAFINRLERFERYLKISDLNLEWKDAGTSEASFTLTTYRFIEPETEERS